MNFYGFHPKGWRTTKVKGLTEAQKATLKLLGAIGEEGQKLI